MPLVGYIETLDEDVYLKYLLCYLDQGNWSRNDKPDRVCFYYPIKSTFRNNSLKSIAASITSFTRINNNSMPPKIKCGANYINSRLGYLDVNQRVHNESQIVPIFLDDLGFVSESSGSCIFLIKGNTIYTPSIESSILPSITRSFLIKIIKEEFNAYSLIETKLDRWDLHNADSLFLVGTNIEICFISRLDHTNFNIELDINYEIYEAFKDKAINA